MSSPRRKGLHAITDKIRTLFAAAKTNATPVLARMLTPFGWLVRTFRRFMARLSIRRREVVYGLLFVMPWIIGYAIFNLYPLIYSFYLSLNDVKVSLLSGINTTFIGFDNYSAVINENPDLVSDFVNYVRDIIVSIPLMLVIAIVLALLLNQKVKGKGLFRMLFFFPVIIISGPVIRDLETYGALSLRSLTDSFFMDAITANLTGFLQGMVVYAFSNIIMFLWYSGVQTIIFLSGLQKIDRQLYEAARVDGAGPWEIFWKITLPSIKPLFAVNIIYSVVLVTNTIDNPILLSARYHMFRNIQTGYGYGSAVAWLLFGIEIVLLSVFLFVFRAKDKGGERA